MRVSQLTYPLDTLRLRLAVDPSVVGMRGAVRVLLREGAGPAFYRGIGVACLGAFPAPLPTPLVALCSAAVCTPRPSSSPWARLRLWAPLQGSAGPSLERWRKC